MGPARRETSAFKAIDDARHRRTLDLFRICQLGDRPLASEHQNGKGGQLSGRNTQSAIGCSRPSDEMNRDRVEPSADVRDASLLHQIGSLPIIRSMMVTGLRQAAQHVDDLDRAVAFYRDVLGLSLIARFDPPGLAFFELGHSRLLLEAGAPSAIHYLGVDDVAASTEQLRLAGVTIESEPHVIHVDDDGRFGPPGEAEEMSFFRDSEGNLVGLAGRRRVDPGS